MTVRNSTSELYYLLTKATAGYVSEPDCYLLVVAIGNHCILSNSEHLGSAEIAGSFIFTFHFFFFKL
jgi:hypothetical protein